MSEMKLSMMLNHNYTRHKGSENQVIALGVSTINWLIEMYIVAPIVAAAIMFDTRAWVIIPFSLFSVDIK